MDCTADLLLVLIWDKTASRTARSKTENRQVSLAMLLLAVPEAVSSHTKNEEQRKAVQFIFCVAPRCSRGSLIPYQNEENQFHPVLALLEAVAPIPATSHNASQACTKSKVQSSLQPVKWPVEPATSHTASKADNQSYSQLRLQQVTWPVKLATSHTASRA